MRLPESFYQSDAETIAKKLLGQILVHNLDGNTLKARIVETEAYVGAHDLACHASKGRTKRTEVMYSKAGTVYVYLIYGMYNMFNIVSGEVDDPQAVLIRAVEPLEHFKEENLKGANVEGIKIEGKTDGPGKLCKALSITRKHNALDLTDEKQTSLFLEQGALVQNVVTTTRVGIDYAKEWKDAPLRFYDDDSAFISKRIKKN